MLYEALKEVWGELTAEGAPFEVVSVPVAGVAVKAFKHAPPTVRELWLSSAQFGERDYLVYQDERIAYAEAHRRTAAIAAWLLREGVEPGDRIAIAMRNYPEWLLVYWAAVSIGVAVVGMNAWWVADEVEYALNDSEPKVVFCDHERLDRILERPASAARTRLVAVRTEGLPPGVTAWPDVVAVEAPMPDVDVDPDADACIFYTSGTTGRPKGAQLTHRGCINNLMNLGFAAQVQALATQKAGGAAPPETPPTPVALLTTPLFHVTANNCGAYAVTAGGGTLVLMYRWDAGEALKLIERERVTSMSGVPVMSREVLLHPDFATRDISSLMSLGGGGAPLQPDLVAKIDAEVATARPNTGYGMTETCGIITAVGGDYFVDRPTSVGPAMPTFETKCVDDDGNEVARGQVGELWVRGASVIKGYLNRPEATAESITDGWLHTGDVARVDADGFIYIVDRKKDMVLRGGENVYCAEVEAAVHHHPAIAECCVFGVPDVRLGEDVAAAVVLREGYHLTADELRAHCADHLSRHKIPAHIWFLAEALPRNANGKFLKRELRETLSTRAAA
jgi:long-chain acyl-CoA synthetase